MEITISKNLSNPKYVALSPKQSLYFDCICGTSLSSYQIEFNCPVCKSTWIALGNENGDAVKLIKKGNI